MHMNGLEKNYLNPLRLPLVVRNDRISFQGHDFLNFLKFWDRLKNIISSVRISSSSFEFLVVKEFLFIVIIHNIVYGPKNVSFLYKVSYHQILSRKNGQIWKRHHVKILQNLTIFLFKLWIPSLKHKNIEI